MIVSTWRSPGPPQSSWSDRGGTFFQISHLPFQIDFYSQTIFNIEKGTLKKQFPFSQVKSYQDLDGLRFLLEFHGHQNYELEADNAEDKQKVSKRLWPPVAWMDLQGGSSTPNLCLLGSRGESAWNKH